MAVMAYPYLVMTDGTDQVVFANGSGTTPNWPLISRAWSPAIGGLRSNSLGGRGLYAEVVENLSCNIRDSSAALCYQDLDTLTRLLDKADRWWKRNDPINPVLLKYVPQGSTIHSIATPLQAIVLGRVGSDELSAVDLPQNLNDAGMIFEIRGIKVLCLRRGYWTGAEDSASSAAAANPSVLTCTLATHPTPSPLSVSISGFQQATTPTIKAGFLVVSGVTSGIQIVEAEGAASGTYTSFADAANNARGGSVLRFTPAVTTTVNSGTISGLSTIGGTIAVLAAVRNNSATTSFSVQANMSALGTLPVSTPPYTVDTSSLQPRLVVLGTLNISQANKLSFTIQASAAAGSLDIDYVILAVQQDSTCAIIAHDDIPLTNLGPGAVSLDFIFNPLTDQNPKVQASGVGGAIPAVYRGMLPLMTLGTTVQAVWTATNGASWRFTTTAPAVMNTTAQATRDKAYLTPQ
jgi:hypothetical protein